MFPSTGIVATTRSAEISTISMPILVVEGAHAVGIGRGSRPRRARRSCTCRDRPPGPRPRCPPHPLGSGRARVHGPAPTPGPPPRPPPSRSAPAAARRPLAGLPGVLRPAGGELLHRHRAAHQRGLRIHLDAGQRAARRAADPRGRRLRPVPADLPPGGVRRVQGQAQQDARRVQQPAAADPAAAGRPPHPAPHLRRLRGRRHHRHADHPGPRRGHGGADPHRRPRLAPAGHRGRRRCSTRCAGSPTSPG